MVQAAKPRHGDDFAICVGIRLCSTPRRRSLRQRKMRSVIVVIADVLRHQSLQVLFVEHNDVVEQVPSAVADPSLCNPILPRTAEAGSLGFDTEGLDCADDFFVEVRAAIKEQISRRRIIGKGLAELLDDPRTGRMPGDIAVKNTTPVVRDNEEAIEHAEGQRRHGEEVHRGDSLTVITQESSPSLCRLGISRRFSHPTQYRSLRDIESEYLQLAVNARPSPHRVLRDHAEDELAQFLVDAPSSRAGPMPREPRPVQLEPGAMPADDGLWLDEDQRTFPFRPEPPQYHPEQPIRRSETGLRVPLLQGSELLPQGQIFQEQIATRTNGPGSQFEQEPQQA